MLVIAFYRAAAVLLFYTSTKYGMEAVSLDHERAGIEVWCARSFSQGAIYGIAGDLSGDIITLSMKKSRDRTS
jgi:hypothetical protein